MERYKFLSEPFKRISCDCIECTKYCLAMPGYLVPDDLYYISKYLNLEISVDPNGNLDLSPLKDYLYASSGTIVKKQDEVFSVPTLVPATKPNGVCIFLDNDKRCSIHQVAPFGCSMFEDHGRYDIVYNYMSTAATMMLAWIWKNEQTHPYYVLWHSLHKEGKTAINPAEARLLMIERSLSYKTDNISIPITFN